MYIPKQFSAVCLTTCVYDKTCKKKSMKSIVTRDTNIDLFYSYA